MKRLSSREVDDRAAVWVAKVDAGVLSADEQTKMQAWLDEDSRHFGAYAKAMAVLAHTDRARALGKDFDPVANRSLDTPWISRRRIVTISAIAASLLFVAGIEVWQLLPAQAYETRLGEIRVVPLEDGSVATLNTNSKIVVRYSRERRDIQLVRGEALFDVSKNSKRPFTVDAAATQVRAVGTSFAISLLPDRPMRVLVREGVVELKRPSVPVAPPVRLSANNSAVVPVDSPIQTTRLEASEVARALSWCVGRLSFEGETLKNAVAEFARYSDVRIEIDDPATAKLTVTGLFVATDPIGFSKALAISFNLHATLKNNTVHISR